MSKGREPLRIPDNWRSQDRQFVIQLERILDKMFKEDDDTGERITELEKRFRLSHIYTTPEDFPAEKGISSSSSLIEIFNAMDDYSLLFISPNQRGWGSYSTLGVQLNGVVLLFKFIPERNFGINFYSTETNSTTKSWYMFRIYRAGTTMDTVLWSDNMNMSGKKDTQTAVSDPTASGTTLSFIATITQNEQGVITATKSSVKTANNLTTTASGSVLDARQGKALKDAIDEVDAKIFVPTATTSNLSDKSIANNTIVNLGSVTLNKGLYLMYGTATFAANSTGYRRLIFADSSTGSSSDRFSVLSVAASADGVTQLQLAWVKNISENSTKVYLNARQTSGGALNVTYPGIRYVKLS